MAGAGGTEPTGETKQRLAESEVEDWRYKEDRSFHFGLWEQSNAPPDRDLLEREISLELFSLR